MKSKAVALAFVLVLATLQSKQHVQAANWTPPTNVFETEGRASNAIILTDMFGDVHIFWEYADPGAEDSGGHQAIYHVKKQGTEWSQPVDVLISPGGRVTRLPNVATDEQGYLHVIWSGGNAIFYSQAPAWEMPSAGIWSTPEPLTSGATSLEPAIATDENGAVYAVWTQAYAGLVFARSLDSGTTWEQPKVIFDAPSDKELARFGRVAVDDAGRIHVTLTYTLDDPSGRYGRTDPNLPYYLRSEDGGETWSEPFQPAAEPDFGQLNVVTHGADGVHLVWNGRAGRHGRYHVWSTDGGKTWSPVAEIISPQHPLGKGGLTGFPALAVDATGSLNFVSTSDPDNFYMRWTNGVWTPPVVITGELDGFGVTRTTRSLESPTIALNEGNTLLVTFHDGAERIWYTSRSIDAPYQPPQAMPPALLAATPSAAAKPTIPKPAATPPASTLPPAAQDAPPANNSAFSPVLAGIVPSLLLVGIVVLVYGTRRRR